MKKILSLIISLAIIAALFSVSLTEAPDKYSIVCTTFPQYDWVRNLIAGQEDQYELTLLLDSGVDLHSYQPTADDLVTIANADLFIYVGGESDEWVADAISAANPDLVAISLVEAMGEEIKPEEIVEGMEHDHEHEHEHEHDEYEEAHEKEVSTFEDDEPQDRPLSDWAGEWQSAYPFVLDGSLDEGFEHKAESGKMSAEEYKAYYATGYESDIAAITIDGETNVITYTDVNGNTCASEYKPLGFYIQYWSTGTKAAMYRFEAVDKESGAPVFIEFNDHIIEPCKAVHFHFRASNTSFDDIEDPENRWPTFYPAEFDAEEMLEAFIGHDHNEEEEEEHEHEELGLEDIQERALSDFAGEWVSLHPMLIAGELDAFLEHKAEEDENATKESMYEKYAANWACDAVSVKIDGDTIAFTDAEGNTCSATYTYAGFTPVTAEDGDITAVRYQYETDSAAAPKYVQFNDHGHEPAAAEHFHLYFGNDGFEAMMASETNSFFAPADMSNEDIIVMLTGHGHESGHDHEHEEEADEHVWLSVRNAAKLTAVIAEAIGAMDADNAEACAANCAAYVETLNAVDAEFQAVADAAAVKTLLFADRFPFRYLVDDYGFDYYAAFAGCSAETEASFETIAFLAEKVDELGLKNVCVIESSDGKIAQTVIASTQAKDQNVVTFDSLQSVTDKNVADGTTYVDVMRNNVEALKAASAN